MCLIVMLCPVTNHSSNFPFILEGAIINGTFILMPHPSYFYKKSIVAWMKTIEEFIHLYRIIVYSRIIQYLPTFVENSYL